MPKFAAKAAGEGSGCPGRVRLVPSEIHVMGEYWLPGGAAITPLGRRVAAAKDGGDVGALAELAAGMAEWAATLSLPPAATGGSCWS